MFRYLIESSKETSVEIIVINNGVYLAMVFDQRGLCISDLQFNIYGSWFNI